MSERLPTDDSMLSGTLPVIETVRKGTAAAPGIAIGRAYLMDRRRLKVPKRHILADELDGEIERFHRALDASDRQLERIKEKIEARFDDHYNIITAHQLILHDEHLVDETVRNIRDRGVNAEWALRKTVEHIRGVFDSIEDDYFRERRSDVEFVGERVLRNLLGRDKKSRRRPTRSGGHDFAGRHRRSTAPRAGLATTPAARPRTPRSSRARTRSRRWSASRTSPRWSATATSSSSTAPTASSCSTPAPRRSRCTASARGWRRPRASRSWPTSTCRRSARTTSVSRWSPTRPQDEIRAHWLRRRGHGGCTEFLFLTSARVPDENDVFRHACSVIESLGGRQVTFRTMDLGADKMAVFMPELHEANPALGLRSIRLCLSPQVRPLFKQQLRGLLRAARSGNMRIMFPMISGVRELDMAIEVMDEAAGAGARRHAVRPRHQGGIMIEMPSAAGSPTTWPGVDFSPRHQRPHQYTLAVDRVNGTWPTLYDSMHRRCIRLIDMVVKAPTRPAFRAVCAARWPAT